MSFHQSIYKVVLLLAITITTFDCDNKLKHVTFEGTGNICVPY